MKVVVLGAGIIGVTTAYQLARRGHEVTIIDKHPASAAECSFANGGQLSYSHVEPWASPSVLPKIPKWLMDKESPLVFHIRPDIKMWAWALKFLASCTGRKAKKSAENMMRLALYSKQVFDETDSELGLQYSQVKKGIIHIFSDRDSLNANIRQAEFQKKLGCDYKVLNSRAEVEELEPAFKNSPVKIIGGILFPMDTTGDVNEFACNLSSYLANRKVKFEYNTTVESIQTANGQVTGVKTDKGIFTADAYVYSLGARSAQFLSPIGINVPIYPLKGYSISIDVTGSEHAPFIGITDQKNKIVYSRLGNIIRVAGTAELIGYDDSITKSRIETLKKMTRELFPDIGKLDVVKEWACLRPSTPDGSPIIGKTKYSNLFLNTGHGTLGWTLSLGSAKVTADIVEGKEPEIDLSGLNLARF